MRRLLTPLVSVTKTSRNTTDSRGDDMGLKHDGGKVSLTVRLLGYVIVFPRLPGSRGAYRTRETGLGPLTGSAPEPAWT